MSLPLPPGFDPNATGPLDRSVARALLEHADELFASGEVGEAGQFYQRVFGHADADISAAALFGIGNVLNRLGQDEQALDAWEQVTRLGETPTTYAAWRQVAAGRVRAGDLPGALQAYREADRRAPREDKAEIASRLGWLSKETGNSGAARRYFARSRGGGAPPWLTYVVLAVTIVVSATIFLAETQTGNQLFNALSLDKAQVAKGEYWRLLTTTLVHVSWLHLGFNMYALWLVGPLVEQLYGWRTFSLIYVLAAIGGSVGSFTLGPGDVSVGASGAIFGLFGVLFAVSRVHRPVLDRRGQAIVGQIGFLIVLNLILGFGLGGGYIDNFAHLGGLLTGLWLGFLLPPTEVATMSSFWRRPAGGAAASRGPTIALRLAGVAALLVVFVVGIVVGTGARQRSAAGPFFTGERVAPTIHAAWSGTRAGVGAPVAGPATAVADGETPPARP